MKNNKRRRSFDYSWYIFTGMDKSSRAVIQNFACPLSKDGGRQWCEETVSARGFERIGFESVRRFLPNVCSLTGVTDYFAIEDSPDLIEEKKKREKKRNYRNAEIWFGFVINILSFPFSLFLFIYLLEYGNFIQTWRIL